MTIEMERKINKILTDGLNVGIDEQLMKGHDMYLLSNQTIISPYIPDSINTLTATLNALNSPRSEIIRRLREEDYADKELLKNGVITLEIYPTSEPKVNTIDIKLCYGNEPVQEFLAYYKGKSETLSVIETFDENKITDEHLQMIEKLVNSYVDNIAKKVEQQADIAKDKAEAIQQWHKEKDGELDR